MSESYSDRWKREFLEQHPEKAITHQADQGAYPVPTSRANPIPSAPRINPQLPGHLPSASFPATPGQVQGILFQRTQVRLASQATQYDAQHSSTRQLVRATCELRYRLQLTQREFAEQLGINLRTWQEWEQGRRSPSGPARILLQRIIEGA